MGIHKPFAGGFQGEVMRLRFPILVLASVMMLTAGQQEGGGDTGSRPGRLTLPPDAERVDSLTHRHTDEDGKTWIYRQTPFGLVRYPDSPASRGSGASPAPAVATPGGGAPAESAGSEPPPGKVPAGAVRIDSLTHRYVDESGKAWIYRQTPFGVVRYEDDSRKSGSGGSSDEVKSGPGPAGSAAAAKVTAEDSGAAVPEGGVQPDPGLKAFDQGDSVRFEKQGPFGKYTWVRKKNELTAQESLAWEAARKQQSPAGPKKEE